MRCAGPFAGLLLAAWTTLGLAAGSPVLRIGNGQEPETLDPHRGEGVSTANLLRDLYEGLATVAPDGRVVPGAAVAWEITGDGLDYRFELRPGARWSNGDPLTAEDFVAGLRRSVDPATGSSFSGMLAPIANAEAIAAGRLPPSALGVSAIAPDRLRIRLARPTPYFLGLLTHSTTFPIHRPSLQQWGRGFARPGRLISNGAYRLEDWVVQSRVVLTRNPHYWNHAATRIDRVEYLATEDLASELKRYRADELDITFQIPAVQAPWLQKAFPDQLRLAPYLGVYYYGFNLTQPPFRDQPGLRRALGLVIDRGLIADKLLHGLAQPAMGWIPPGTHGATPAPAPWARASAEQRLAEARRLYAAAGYSAERPLEVEIRYNTHEDHRRIAVLVAAMWKQQLGIRVRLVNEEGKVFVNNRRLRRVTQVFRASWIADYDDASSFTDILRSDHGQNDTGWAQPRYDALLDAAAREPDAARRAALLAEAEALIFQDWPVIPIYWYRSKHLVKPRVLGWRDNPLDYHYSKDLALAPE